MSIAPAADHGHRLSSLGRFNNIPIAVAGLYNRKVEELKNGVWRTLDDFPFVEEALRLYSMLLNRPRLEQMVTLNDALYLFGTFLLFINLFDNIFKGVKTGERV